MSKIILIKAVNGSTESRPIKVYLTDEAATLPRQFVLRLDEGVDRNGKEVLKLNNFNLNLIGSHDPEFLTQALTGFRRDKDEVTYIIAEQFKDVIPGVSNLAKEEAY